MLASPYTVLLVAFGAVAPEKIQGVLAVANAFHILFPVLASGSNPPSLRRPSRSNSGQIAHNRTRVNLPSLPVCITVIALGLDPDPRRPSRLLSAAVASGCPPFLARFQKQKGGGGDTGKHKNAADDAEAKKREQRARANERKRERRAEVRAQALAKDTATINGDETTDKLPPLRVAINSPGMGWLQPVRTSSAQGGGSGSGGGGGGKKKASSPAAAARAAAMEETADSSATAAAAVVAACSPKSKARIERVASAADAIAARVSSGAMGGGGSFGGGGADSNATHGVGGPWAHAAGVKNVAGGGGTAAGFFSRSSTPMCPEAVKALLADPEKSKMFLSNLLGESVREVESAKRKRDQVKGERKRLARDRSKAQQARVRVKEGKD
ncbi:unnamed protein product [Ectocarpus sp. CCAP 1310/34]|nr:unnamed protein product [Ectocarpus sp. CCAP 1310/34]